MVVFVLDNASESLRGRLCLWCLELKPGVFVGVLSKVVREYIWELICKEDHRDGALMVWSTNTEQQFDMRMIGTPRRQVVDFDGVNLIFVDKST